MTLMTVFEVNKSHGHIFRVSNSKATKLKQLGSTERPGDGWEVARRECAPYSVLSHCCCVRDGVSHQS